MVMGELTLGTQLLVIGAGPAGYAAAFRAADLGFDVTLVDANPRPGGVCLYRGCIPSKTYLHLAQIIEDAYGAEDMGLYFTQPRIDLAVVRRWKASVVERLSKGLASLCRQRGVQFIQGRAVFSGSGQVRMQDAEVRRIDFDHAILATGSHAALPSGISTSVGGRVMTSAAALELAEVPDTLLVIGAGYVGLELGSLYAALGSRVTVVEQGDRLLSGVDGDLASPLQRRLEKRFSNILYNTIVTDVGEQTDNVRVSWKKDNQLESETFQRVLVAVGREPNTREIGLENTGVKTDHHGYVITDSRQRTADPQIYAAGDVTGGMLLAHKATREGKVAAEVIAGQASAFDVQAMPAVVYTQPQVAWCGLTEEQARRQGRPVTVQRFPWKFSGRALSMDAADGLTKLITDPTSGRILGIGVVGREAEGLIAEGVLAIEMGALAEDLALVVHAHPTLSETEGEAAEIFSGSATHLIVSPKATG